MTHTIRFTIPGEPIAQPRAKATAFGGHVRLYTPTSRTTQDGRKSNGVAEWKALARRIAADAYIFRPLDCPVRIDCTWVFPRPKAMIWKKKPMPRVEHTSKPDRDNLDKILLDSLTGVVLRDDKIVSAGMLEKWIAAGDEQPHTEVVITWND